VIGELSRTVASQIIAFTASPSIVEYRDESIVMAVARLVRSVGNRSATLFFETINTDDEVVDQKLFAVRVAHEWNGEFIYLADRYTQSSMSGASVFSNVCETVQLSAGFMDGFNSISDSYPIHFFERTGFYHYRGIEAKCRISPWPTSFVNGVHTIRSPKVSIFRLVATHTKRYFVRRRANYVPNDAANPFLLAPSGDNTVTAGEATGEFTEGMVYTGDEHPEISLTGARRPSIRTHAERTDIEPFYYLADLRGGKRMRVTYRELDEGTGDPVMSNEYPEDGTARSDQTIINSGAIGPGGSLNGATFGGSQCTFIPLM
jgi:hypothetical protein